MPHGDDTLKNVQTPNSPGGGDIMKESMRTFEVQIT